MVDWNERDKKQKVEPKLYKLVTFYFGKQKALKYQKIKILSFEEYDKIITTWNNKSMNLYAEDDYASERPCEEIEVALKKVPEPAVLLLVNAGLEFRRKHPELFEDGKIEAA